MVTKVLKYNEKPLGVAVLKVFDNEEATAPFFGVSFVTKNKSEEFDRELLTAKAVLNAERGFKAWLNDGDEQWNLPKYLEEQMFNFVDQANTLLAIDPSLGEDQLEDDEEIFAVTKDWVHSN